MSTQYVALYRKYRPETFSDVVGQEHVVTLLTSAITQKKISHAYLFCGGRGTGKTTTARIFARDIGCNPEDVIEIDAASNRGIDEIRELREAVRTAPFSSPYKVYIIDEAHMLTKEAANALLKTLEEPPSHVVFILATTDPDKLPQTIVSRCQKVVFSSPDHATLASRLMHVSREERVTLPEESALLIAHHGKGSYRDALGVLEQIITTGTKEVKHADVVKFLGVPDTRAVFALVEALCQEDSTKIVTLLVDIAKKQSNALRVYDEMIDLVRQGLLIRVGGLREGEMALLAKEHPHILGSKLLLNLLEKRHLLEVSDDHAWIAFEAIVLEGK
jgi:DNA polymerase III subunit gamma/tau